ncbi:hypothetical protein HMPREF0653_02609 [Prevotella disiens JCM 6334 = ATCC 29426]|uniref:Uncharacterized protein n=1 Tax=Prevotella disiens JCM 6334 = ATCC 29426 TaxID=1235811 RepID=A0ABN0NNT3_9BACT|nr:hypothetical protein HMPREF0653_02609 [Prevotella disiens JCM 6334 = ATCC 29426]
MRIAYLGYQYEESILYEFRCITQTKKNTNIDYQAHIRSIEKSYEVRKRWF